MTKNIETLSPPTLADDAFSNKVVLVTGANRGIGRSVAMLCARHGAQVLLCGRDVKGLEKVDDQIRAEGCGLCTSIRGDGPRPANGGWDFSSPNYLFVA